MNIRPATAADVPAMMALERRAATAAHWSVADYARLFGAGSQYIALVLEEEQVEGFLVARGIGTEWELENIAVAGAARRRGLATRLLIELLDRARRGGARHMFLEVRESNRAARSLYERWDFIETGRRKDYYQDPAEDGVLYRFTFSSTPGK